MQIRHLSPSDWRVGTKIAVFTFALVSAITATLLSLVNVNTSRLLTEQAHMNIDGTLKGIGNTVEVFNTAVTGEASIFARLFSAGFANGKFTVDAAHTIDIGGRPVPTLRFNDQILNLDFSAPDKFTRETGVLATIFVASGAEFVRVSTSLKKENGERAVGTQLDHNHPSYGPLRAGKGYSGLATLFSKPFITQYDPIKDDAGNVIGVLFIGVDISADMSTLKKKIKAIKLGETGYVFVIDAANGKARGNAIVHPTKEGENLLNDKSANNRPFIREMLDAKQGSLNYEWAPSASEEPRPKMAGFYTFGAWNWLIVGSTYSDEITAEARSIRNRYALLGLLLLMVFTGALYLLIRKFITYPLARATTAASCIAQGNLDVHLEVDQKDEIGQVLFALNDISSNLSLVVGRVRAGAEQISTASSQIAAGNLDLSSRTEEQAATLEETSASMERLSSAVKQNARIAADTNRMAQAASDIAAKGGAMVEHVVATMGDIHDSSSKIADIIAVIDSIAFQTNILALNAAVEAARAGEQGRGFAVVATEVRNLAQRSAGAAREIKQLIEESVSKVSIGSKQVENAGLTMVEVVDSVKSMTTMMASINEASMAQQLGIDQVYRAIAEMDQVTQQNSALVEEAAAAAHGLEDQASDLEQVVRVFNLRSDGGGAEIWESDRPHPLRISLHARQ